MIARNRITAAMSAGRLTRRAGSRSAAPANIAGLLQPNRMARLASTLENSRYLYWRPLATAGSRDAAVVERVRYGLEGRRAASSDVCDNRCKISNSILGSFLACLNACFTYLSR